MTTIDKIGPFTIARHGAVIILIDRQAGGHEIFTRERDARDAALERVDLVDALAATVH